MINILHTIDTTGPGGAETVFLDLVKRLDAKQFRSFVAIRGAGWVNDELLKLGVSPIYINSKGSLSFSYLWQLVRCIREYKIDVVQSHLLGTNLYSSLAGLLCRVPVVATFHGFVDVQSNERFARVKLFIINNGASFLVYVSDNLRAFYIDRKGFRREKSVTIYNGVDTSRYCPCIDSSVRTSIGLSADDVLVGSVGNIRTAKGYEYLLNAARRVVDSNPRFYFAVAGGGGGGLRDKLLQLRKDLMLEKNFFFLDYQPDVATFLNNLDIFVLPSVTEGFSISTLEAMACGVPVIATRSGGPEEIIHDGETGFLVDPCDAQALATAIVDVYGAGSKARTCAANALDVAKSTFSSATMMQKYQHLYRTVLGASC
ncbi:glycosyltransferase [Geomonas anaerohicana]|uniref:Glycosyltransferase n=1 Tax=Geomonas anaerohicana TaxID=2798583 RepID=A0ABS0YBZ0_9BACT|nr:glycosyltransferase [Geomonas anaerohicana]MBJ6749828.1 glycosyltransferase [Geomonas anaerohicana]